MAPGSFREDFKHDAVAQITERGYPVAEVPQRLGVSPPPEAIRGAVCRVA